MTALLYTWVITICTMLLPASTILTIHSLYTSEWCMPTHITTAAATCQIHLWRQVAKRVQLLVYNIIVKIYMHGSTAYEDIVLLCTCTCSKQWNLRLYRRSEIGTQ